MNSAFKAYLEYFENLTPENVGELRNIATADFHFVDPFNDVHSVETAIDIFSDMFQKLREPSFKILDSSETEQTLYVKWLMSFKSLAIQFGKQTEIEGISVVKLNQEGKICEHIDYWDAYQQFFEKLSGVGLFFRGVRWLLPL